MGKTRIVLTLVSLLLIAIAPWFNTYVKCEGPKLLRMLEVKVSSNSTVTVRVSSTSLTWQFFKEYFYESNESYWHSRAVSKIVEMFDLSDYRILLLGERETGGAFIVEMVFQLDDSGRYDEKSGRLSIIDAFKEEGEYLSSVVIESEINIYDCSNRDRAWPRSWYSTRRLEWSNSGFDEAPDEYDVFFKIPIRVVTNLPPDSVWRIYIDSKPMEVVGNSSMIYVNEGDLVRVERIFEYGGDTRYVCYSPSAYVLYPFVASNRTLSFQYGVEYMVYFGSKAGVESLVFNGIKYSLPFETWVGENALVNATVTPASVQGSFLNYVFQGWVDDKGEKFGETIIVTRPMRLSAFWKEELNVENTAIVIATLTIGFLIPELRKRASIEVAWKKPEGENE